jgi:hypothetical protein
MNPLQTDNISLNTFKKDSSSGGSTLESRREALDQSEIPWHEKIHAIDPNFHKCDKKIIRYSTLNIASWKVRFVLASINQHTLTIMGFS